MNKLIPIALLLAGCQSTPNTGTADQSLAILRAIGDAAIRVDGTAALQKHAPEALALLDVAPKDGVLTLAEVESFLQANQSPEQLTWTLILVRGLIEAQRGG